MKVLIVAEGKHESGGALQTLVSRLLTKDVQIDQTPIRRRGLHVHHGKGQGFHKRAMRWFKEARKDGYEAIILLADEDGDRERVRQMENAQNDQRIPIRRACGIAIRTFDAWMLADEQALAKVLGYTVPCQPDPESMRDPKRVCASLRDANPGCQLSQSDMYAAVARELNIASLETRCPKGFAPFAQRVRAL